MATYDEIKVANRALYELGIGDLIAGTGDLSASTSTSAAKEAAEFALPFVRDEVLGSSRWTFARAYATMVQADDGTGEVWADEWDYAYTLPSDCLRAVRIVNGNGISTYSLGWVFDHSFSPWPGHSNPASETKFVIRHHDGARVLLSDVDSADAKLEYIKQLTDFGAWPDTAVSAVVLRLAYELSGPLMTTNGRDRGDLWNGYRVALQRARANDGDEQQPLEESDGPHLRARGGH